MVSWKIEKRVNFWLSAILSWPILEPLGEKYEIPSHWSQRGISIRGRDN